MKIVLITKNFVWLAKEIGTTLAQMPTRSIHEQKEVIELNLRIQKKKRPENDQPRELGG